MASPIIIDKPPCGSSRTLYKNPLIEGSLFPASRWKNGSGREYWQQGTEGRLVVWRELQTEMDDSSVPKFEFQGFRLLGNRAACRGHKTDGVSKGEKR